MHQPQAQCKVRRLCQLLEVSRSGYDEWRRRPPCAHAAAAQAFQDNITRDCAQGRGTYGMRRSQPLLAPDGLQVRCRRLGRLLAQAGRRCTTRRQYKAPRTAGQAQTAAPNQRKRALTVQAPDKVYVGDRISLPTGAGWLSLAGGLDLCSRAVVGWALADHRRAELVNHAWARASSQRRPAAGLMRHTDRGSQYGAASYRQLLVQHGRQPSMSRTGHGWANAVAESFCHTLKTA